MKIFVNEYFEIVDVDSTDNSDLTEYEIDGTMFEDKCIEFIRGYRYEPAYEFEYTEDGEIKLDENGNPVFAVDEMGQKIINGWSFYPWIDYSQLCQVQLEYELNQVKEENTQLQLALCQSYEENLSMAEDLENTQLALTDVYEQLLSVASVVQ